MLNTNKTWVILLGTRELRGNFCNDEIVLQKHYYIILHSNNYVRKLDVIFSTLFFIRIHFQTQILGIFQALLLQWLPCFSSILVPQVKEKTLSIYLKLDQSLPPL